MPKGTRKFFDSDPPVPEREYPIDPVRLARAIEVAREPTKTYLKHLQYVSFAEFETALCACVAEVAQQIGPNATWVPCLGRLQNNRLVPATHKSNIWIANLMDSFCVPNLFDTPPAMVLKEMSQFDELFKLAMVSPPVHIVFFDDMLFSGQQMEATVSLVAEGLYNNWAEEPYETLQKIFLDAPVCSGGKPRIVFHIICPYRADKNQLVTTISKPATFCDRQYQYSIYRRIPVFLYSKHIVPTYPASVFGGKRAPSIYFSHKLADYVSVQASDIAPLIQGCEEVYSREKLDTASPQCPWPPYKPRPKRLSAAEQKLEDDLMKEMMAKYLS
jgi:hypothetical protein